MNHTAYFSDGRWHNSLPPARTQGAELTMMELMRRVWAEGRDGCASPSESGIAASDTGITEKTND